jgi:hypothetical protein
MRVVDEKGEKRAKDATGSCLSGVNLVSSRSGDSPATTYADLSAVPGRDIDNLSS